MHYEYIMITTFNPKPSKVYERTFAHVGMIIPPSGIWMRELVIPIPGPGNGVVVVIFWVGRRGKYRNNPLIWMR